MAEIINIGTGKSLGIIGEWSGFVDSRLQTLNIGDVVKINSSGEQYLITNESCCTILFAQCTKIAPFSYDWYKDTKEYKFTTISLCHNAIVVDRLAQIIFNDKCTIAILNNQKAVVKCHEEEFDEEKGMYMALLKLNGYTHSKLKKELSKIGCNDCIKAEKAYAYALLVNKYSYTNDMLASLLKNAQRQTKKGDNENADSRKDA